MKSLFNIFIASLLFACSSPEEGSGVESGFAEEELMAQAIVQFASPGEVQKVFVICSPTRDPFADTGHNDVDPFAAPEPEGGPRTPDQRYADILASSRLIEADLAQRFVEQSKVPLNLDQGALPEGSQFVVLSESDYDVLFPLEEQSMEAGWKRFNERYPEADGLASVSRVVFSSDGRTALMSISLSWGPLSGKSGFFVFRRVGWLWVCKQPADAPWGVS